MTSTLEYKCVKNIKLGYIPDSAWIIDLYKTVVLPGSSKRVLIALHGYVSKETDHKTLQLDLFCLIGT